jgi:Peptidase family C25
MANKADKVILTNLSTLNDKYASRGVQPIKSGITQLIAADKKRGLNTRLIALDDKSTMRSLKAPAVTDAADRKQNKLAVDGVYRALNPDYLMLLGSCDVIPHQDLKNPLFDGTAGKDPDKWAYGDIPYACEAGYSQNPQDFKGPTRVVGRLPDLTGGKDPTYLTDLLSVAANWKAVDRNDITDYFAVTAAVWQASTELSTTNIFGNASTLQEVPPKGPAWTSQQLKSLVHFFNCHGALDDDQFYGQPADGSKTYPVALSAADLDGSLSRGVIAAAECCYGAQLYAADDQTHIPICNTYLRNQAYAFFGSTTIAYGLSEGNGEADLMCSFFLERVLAGASTGRAALEARQKFVQVSSPPDPSDWKTLAQYNLYGDPSITPISGPAAASKAILAGAIGRAERRRNLFALGATLERTIPTIHRRAQAPHRRLLSPLKARATELGFRDAQPLTFAIKYPRLRKSPSAASAKSPLLPSSYHVMVLNDTEAPRGHEDRPKIRRLILLIGKESGGKLLAIEEIHSR